MALLLFCAALLLCLLLDLNILCALCFGLLVFLLHGRRKGFSWRALFGMALDGVKTVRGILLTFLFIGVMTAFWRAAGTIPVLVCFSAALIRPSIFLLMCFLLNCALSFLMGTSFGTASTMGVICAAMGRAMGINPILIGGAVLSGVYFGDRCSPVSTSALLVAEVTGTDIFGNIRRMLRSALIPFGLSCLVYALLGRLTAGQADAPDLRAVFGQEFALRLPALIPAAVILLLSLLHVPVRPAMGLSILTAVPLCLFLQHRTLPELAAIALTGFHAADPEVASMLDGGGILSMLRVSCIVCLSASYSDLFRKTGMLDPIKGLLCRFAMRSTPFAAMLLTAVVSCCVACNQSLSSILCCELCGDLYTEREQLALDEEDSVVVVAALIPWCIACAVPLSAVGAPSSAVLAACYLYLLPLWRLAVSFVKRKGAA